MRAAVLAVLAAAGSAAAEPRGSASAELRIHPGDSEKDEVVHPGLFPSIVLGGGVHVTDDIEVRAVIAAAKVTATWENIGGLANGFVEGRLRSGTLDRRWTFGVGIAVPLDTSIPAADCFMPEKPGGGDSLVLDYGTDSGCWDRSAYRRASLHRGGWNMWLWAPDWITTVVTARLEGRAGDVRYAVEAGTGVAFAITDAHDDGKRAVIGQLGGEVARVVSPRWILGVRALAAGAVLDDESPLLISAEPYAEVAPRDDVRVRLSLLVPLADLSNDDVSPGLGGYKPSENVSIGVTGVVTIGR